MNVVSCPLQCKSHQALSCSHGIGGSGFTHPMDLIMRPWDRLEQTRHLVAGLRPLNGARYWFDAHFSWNNVDPNDSRPIGMSTFVPIIRKWAALPMWIIPGIMKFCAWRLTAGTQKSGALRRLTARQKWILVNAAGKCVTGRKMLFSLPIGKINWDRPLPEMLTVLTCS